MVAPAPRAEEPGAAGPLRPVRGPEARAGNP